MNKAVSLQRSIPKSRTVTALNPNSRAWEQARVTGTYQRDKIGDLDRGFVLDFGDGVNREINQKHIVI